LNEKRERVLRTSPREKKIEFQERIYNPHIGSFSPGPFGWFAPPSLLGSREPTLSWNQLHASYEKGCQEKKLLPAPLGDAGVVTYIQPHLIPHLIVRVVMGLVMLTRLFLFSAG
jgi:hypothetical protein